MGGSQAPTLRSRDELGQEEKETFSLSLDGRGLGEGEAATPPPGLLPQGEKESIDADCLVKLTLDATRAGEGVHRRGMSQLIARPQPTDVEGRASCPLTARELNGLSNWNDPPFPIFLPDPSASRGNRAKREKRTRVIVSRTPCRLRSTDVFYMKHRTMALSSCWHHQWLDRGRSVVRTRADHLLRDDPCFPLLFSDAPRIGSS